MKTALFLFVAILTMFVVGCDRTPRFTFVPFIEKQLDSTCLLSHGDIILVDHAPKDTIERVKMMIDSLYTVMFKRLGAETSYAPVIRFWVDSLVPQYNPYEFESRSEYFFSEPLRYLTRTELDGDYSFVTLTDDAHSGSTYYLLLNASDSIVWCRPVDLYRTRILTRELRDWNRDGKKEIVEVRENIVSGFVGIKEYVFTIRKEKLRLLFCIELSGTSYLGTDSLSVYLTRRSYQRLDNGLYRITECKSPTCDRNNPQGKTSIIRYTISADSLINQYAPYEK